MSLELNGVPQGAFAGPLLDIFPDSSFDRPSRVDRDEWDEVMGVGKWRYPAEDSGAAYLLHRSATIVTCLDLLIIIVFHGASIGKI